MKKLLFLFPIVLTAQIQQYPGGSGGGGSVTITSPGGSLNVGGTPSAPTLDVSTTYLNSLYVQLSPTSAQSITPGATGARTNFVNTAATGGLTLSGSNIPSNLHAGDIGTNLSGFFWVDDGTNVNIVPWVAGSGTTVATAPTSGQVATWGSTFTQVGFPGLTNTQPVANETQVTVTAGSSDDNTGNSIFRVRSSNGTTFLDMEANSAAGGGRVGLYGSSSYIADLSANTYQLGQSQLKVGSLFIYKFTSSDFTGSVDTGFTRHGAGVLELDNGTGGGNGGLFIAGLTSSNTGDYVCWNAGAFEQNATACAVSSERFKHNIKPLSSSLSKVLSMKPITFYYNPGYGDNYSLTQPDRPEPKKHMGFLAEDAINYFPELVPLDKEGKPVSFDYPSYVAALTSAIQELQKEINELKRHRI